MMEKKWPEGWLETKIEDCTIILDNLRQPINAQERSKKQGHVPYYGATGQVGWIDEYIFDEELVLLGEDGAPFFDKKKNVAFLISGKSWVNNHAHVIKEKKGLTVNGFLLHYFNYVNYTDFVAGTTRLKLTQGSLREMTIPLAPPAEQTRIVAKLDAAFAHLDILKMGLARIPELLKKFRRTILTQAVMGKLTEDWREENELEKTNLIDLNKARFYLQEAKSKERGRFKFTYKQPVSVELGGRTKGLEQLYDLPETWQWVSMDQILWNISDGPHFSPNYVKKEDGIKFISSRNVFYDKINFLDAKYVSKENHELFIQRGKPEVGDVLLTKGGTTGIAHAIKHQEEFSVWVHVALLKVVKEFIHPEYLRDFLTSSFGYIQSQVQTHGVGNQDLGLTRMIFFAIPLPPLKEQQEIVARVEALFAKADALEEQYLSLKARIDKLPQALLAKAFRGELVPQDPTDEPASVLLEKIKAVATKFGKKSKTDSQTSFAFMEE